MDKKLIYGIQQIGVGVYDAMEAFSWYARHLGSDANIFDDNNTATFMAPYMGGEPRRKRAILAMNLQGGSGFELWQYVDRTPQKFQDVFRVGDLGINIAKVKSKNIEKSYKRLKKQGVEVLGEINIEPDSARSFHIKDPYDNILRIKEFNSWYQDHGYDVGGTYGCVIGVSDIDKSRKLYSDVLGYDEVVYDKTGSFTDLQGLPNGNGQFRRILLTHKPTRFGGFSRIFGDSQLELIQMLDNSPRKLFANRFWGDIGYIHLCFDIRNMSHLVKECSDRGFPFKVLSGESFDMGDANGHFGYIEDPDGTLIEFVETNKVPIIKKLNLHINLRKRDPHKPLPNWMIKALNFKRVKFKEK